MDPPSLTQVAVAFLTGIRDENYNDRPSNSPIPSDAEYHQTSCGHHSVTDLGPNPTHNMRAISFSYYETLIHMAQHNEHRTRDGRRFSENESRQNAFDSSGSTRWDVLDGFCDKVDFVAREEIQMMNAMDIETDDCMGGLFGDADTSYLFQPDKDSNTQLSYELGFDVVRRYLEYSTNTIDNVKSKIHGSSVDKIEAWCFSIMSIFAITAMLLVECPRPRLVDGWSHIEVILRLVFILGIYPVLNQEDQIQGVKECRGTTRQEDSIDDCLYRPQLSRKQLQLTNCSIRAQRPSISQ